jgi:hypothetical protein
MGKIIASYLLKVHYHEVEAVDLSEPPGPDGVPPTAPPPTIDELRHGVADKLQQRFGGIWTVSLAERTDAD